MIKDERLYIIHIVESIDLIFSYVEGYNFEQFTSDRKTYDATLRNLQIMAESTQRLTQATKDKYRSIPWHSIAGFRNILVHDYLGDINDYAIWNIIQVNLPVLREILVKECPIKI